jgi:phage terminase large subunit
MFRKTTAQKKIIQLRARTRVVQGGTSASKTFSILPVLITYAINNPKVEISVVSETVPHLRRGAIRDFIKILDWTNNYDDDKWNKSTLTYFFTNGSYIEFFSAEQESKLRGARRDVLFVNEANNISWLAYHQLAIRTRRFIYIDYNPVAEFWAHTELIGRPNVDFVRLTYRDNEALEPSIIEEIEAAKERAVTSSYWANWYSVYGLGEVGILQGVIFDNWIQIKEVNFSTDKFVAIGMDWGYTNDPTTIIAVYLRGNDKLVLHELLYENKLTNADIGNKLKELNINRSWQIVADSAEPKSIEEIRRMGYNIQESIKGPDSVRNGIDILKRFEICVTETSLNLIKELRSYVWETDKTGAQLGFPQDKYNHAIDAVRYVALNKLSKSAGGRYVII